MKTACWYEVMLRYKAVLPYDVAVAQAAFEDILPIPGQATIDAAPTADFYF